VDVREFLHCQVQCRQRHSPPSRIAFEKPLDCRLAVLGELHCHTCPHPLAYRSFSPAIMLIVPNVATMSATMPPLSIFCRPCISVKHGGRTRHRYGRPVPSLTI